MNASQRPLLPKISRFATPIDALGPPPFRYHRGAPSMSLPQVVPLMRSNPTSYFLLPTSYFPLSTFYFLLSTFYFIAPTFSFPLFPQRDDAAAFPLFAPPGQRASVFRFRSRLNGQMSAFSLFNFIFCLSSFCLFPIPFAPPRSLPAREEWKTTNKKPNKAESSMLISKQNEYRSKTASFARLCQVPGSHAAHVRSQRRHHDDD